MRFTRTAAGRLELTLLDGPDHGVAQDVSRALRNAFNGESGQPLHDIDGSTWVDILIGQWAVTIHVARHYTGTCIYAANVESDGLILDIANHLAARATELGLEPIMKGNVTV